MQVQLASAGGSLSPELCGRIVKWARGSDLPFLARTCKSFQTVSEKRIYDTLVLGNPTVAFDACRSISTAERLGPYVHQFFIYQDQNRYRNVTLHVQFWQMVQAAMNHMCNLEKFYIHDPAGHNTFVLDPTQLNFQLDDAQIRINWDAHVVDFLASQLSLDRLTVMYGPDNFEYPLAPDALPALKQFIGAITVAVQLLTRPLTHLQVHVDETSSVPVLSFIRRLSATSATLRSLSFLELPDAIAIDALKLISTTCPQLRYVGVLSFPSRHREKIHRCLMNMHNLRIMELDLTKWDPQPTGALQKILTTELRIFCPSVEFIAFWVGGTRFFWTLDGDNWTYHYETGQNIRFEPIWKNV